MTDRRAAGRAERRLILFDLDGTLADTRADITAAANAALAAAGLGPLSIEQVISVVGRGVRNTVARTLELAGGDCRPEIYEPALKAFMDYYTAHPADHTRLYPGVSEMLESLRRSDCALAVLSNKAQSLVELSLERLGVRHYFDPVVGGGPEIPLKPDPTGIRLALARRGVGPEAAVMVGDMALDGQAAAAAGVTFVAVLWGYGRAEDLAALTPLAARRPADLPGLLGL